MTANTSPSPERLEQLFVGGDFLKPQEFAFAKQKAVSSGLSVPEAIVELGYLSDHQVGRLLSDELGYFFVDLAKEKVEPHLLSLLPETVANAQQIVVYKKDGQGYVVATPNVGNYEFFKLLEKTLQAPVAVHYGTGIGVATALKGYEKDLVAQIRTLIQKMKANPQDEDVVKLVQVILAAANEARASDVHIEPEEEDVVVRFRIDGAMHEIVRYPLASHEKVVFRIKILARMRTDEHAQAQDGRFELKLSGVNVNLRVSILPITHGENVVMRLLSEGFQRLRLEDLGLQEDDLEKVKRAAGLPHGMILAAGPTGSGKTTTLYALINILNQPDVNVMTIEDPVEYDIRGIRQIQVNPRTNLTFEAGLKAIVRQDPDVIMVGEVRDPATAGIAVNAALTGHLMLSSLHANDAATVFPRLYEFGVESFLIASSVNVVVAQRLVRRVCSSCLETTRLTKEEAEAIERDLELHKLIQTTGGKKEIGKLQMYHGRGCTTCGGTGFVGRMGIFEILEVTEAIRPLIVEKASSEAIRTRACELGMRSMMEDGVEKVFQGKTTISEILRATKA